MQIQVVEYRFGDTEQVTVERKSYSSLQPSRRKSLLAKTSCGLKFPRILKKMTNLFARRMSGFSLKKRSKNRLALEILRSTSSVPQKSDISTTLQRGRYRFAVVCYRRRDRPVRRCHHAQKRNTEGTLRDIVAQQTHGGGGQANPRHKILRQQTLRRTNKKIQVETD